MTKYRKSVKRFKSHKVTKKRKYKTRKNKIKKISNKIKTRNKSKMQKGGNLQDLFILAEQYYDQLPERDREYVTDVEELNEIAESKLDYVDNSEFYQQFVDIINGLYEDDIINGYNHMLQNITYLDVDEHEGNFFDAIHGVPKQIIEYAVMQHTDNTTQLPSQYSEENATACKLAILYYIMLLPIYERFEDQNAYIDNLEHTFGWFRENNMLK